MKFLIDAQLPRKLARLFNQQGVNAIHTLDLPEGNKTSDNDITNIADKEYRIVITKDSDFVDSFIINRKPAKLLLISTGNITNKQLEALMIPRLPKIVDAFKSHNYIELTYHSIITHE